ncbi:AtpZ/AtpI family protein [Aquihabitans sp. G128]|uniref:AtpZ/AtpI family protein n=1 Tax=Aquihabitans sp. G128 TaxID=2849779 RepID=UPI001C22A335|nr:AtpZ/AtpI family protein [Aquihabitans sp. G128]QXC63168.1 AtpZ/AtpI family protein [Aquihabitans sp. G128]
MSDPHLTAPGNAAPSGPAESPSAAPARTLGDRPVQKRNPVARFVLASAAGTSSPLHRDNYAVATNRGYGEAMGRGLELALTLLVMVGLGYGVDHLAGTAPLFTILFSVLGFAGISVKLYVGYDLEMRRHEDGAIWNRGTSGQDRSSSGPEATA